MSQANIKLIQDLYARFGHGDIAGILGMVDPRVQWDVIGRREDYPLFGERRGVAGVVDFFETLSRCEEITEFAPGEIHASGDKVFVTGHAKYVLKATGKTAASDWVHVFAIADGRVTAFREFLDTAQIAAAHSG